MHVSGGAASPFADAALLPLNAACCRARHPIDQGAICHNDDQPSMMALPTCRGWVQTGALGGHNVGPQHGNDEQPILFSCIEFYSTEW